MNARIPPEAELESVDIAIIGSGFAGLCMAIRLKQAGIDDFFVAEKADSLGGTWRDNHYPGCACDVQSHVYSFSFAPNPDWTRMFAPQAEIRSYLETCAQRFGVEPHLRFNEALERAVFDEPRQRWLLDFSQRTARVGSRADIRHGRLVAAGVAGDSGHRKLRGQVLSFAALGPRLCARRQARRGDRHRRERHPVRAADRAARRAISTCSSAPRRGSCRSPTGR